MIYHAALLADSVGSVYVAFDDDGIVNLGAGPMTASGRDIFIAKYLGSGNHAYSVKLGGAGDQYVNALALTPEGELTAAGGFEGSIVVGGQTHVAVGRDGYVVKLSSAGLPTEFQKFGDAPNQEVFGVAISTSGQVSIAGIFEGTMDFGGGPLTAVGTEGFLAVLAPDWSHVSSRVLLGPNHTRKAVNDASGNTFLCGSIQGNADFGGGPLPFGGGWDAFLAKFAADGTPLWSWSGGNVANQVCSALAVSPSGEAVFGGLLQGTMDVGAASPLAATAVVAGWLARFSP
jgi:hypothetical protein